MKKILFLLLSAGLSFIATGQEVKFALFGGPQLSTASYRINSQQQDTKMKAGFQFGGALKVPFDVQLYFAPAVFYSMKGYKVNLALPSYPPDSTAINNNTTFHTFELAALLQFDFSNRPNHFFVKAGPTLDFQLFGKEKFHTNSDATVDRNIPFGFGAYGHYSANFLFQLGYETKNGLLLFGQYSHGLGSINNADEGPKIMHRVIGVSIGKYLNWKKS